MKVLSAVFAVLFLAACTARDARLATAVTDTLSGGIVRVTSSGPTGWADTNGWRLVELPAIQPAQGAPGELIDPSSIAVDNLGRLYVADQKPVVIKVFDAAGTLVRSIGREGDGPGEFRSAFIAIRGNRLMVHDPAAQRTSFFDTSGTFVRGFHSVGMYWAPVALDAAGRAVLPMIYVTRSPADAGRRRTFYRARFDSLGNLIDTLWVPELTEDHSWRVEKNGLTMMAVDVPFAPHTIDGYGRDSGAVFGASTDFAIMRSAGHGDTTFIMRRTWTAEPLADSIRNGAIDAMVQRLKGDRFDEVTLRDAFHLSDIPSTKPSFSQLVVDDKGNTWAQRMSDNGRTEFDVFGPSGAWLGPVTLSAAPLGYAPLVISHGVMYVALEDENGFPVIRRWAVRGGQDGHGGQE